MSARTEAERTEFVGVLATWTAAARAHAEVKRTYRIAHGNAVATSTAKSAEQRKAEADALTVDLRAKLDDSEIIERSAFHLMVFLRGGALSADDT